MQRFKIHKIEKLPDWEAVISGEIPLDFLHACRKDAIKHINEHIDLPGFRKGMVPEEVLVKTVGESHVLEEAAEIALGKEYGNIVTESKLRPMMRPNISVTKLAPGIPLEFKVSLVLEPEFELPDYKKVASEIVEEDLEKRRLKMLDELIKATELELPKKFIEAELSHTLHHFKEDVEKAGIKWAEYLEKVKKSEEEIKESWRENIVSHAKAELILGKIAEKENLKTYQEVFELLEKK